MSDQKPTAEEALATGKMLHINPQGNSMLPLIREGRDSVYIRKASLAEVRKGDVVLCRDENSRLVLHRLCKKTPTGFYMVGDHQLISAGPYEERQLLGKMVAMERNGKYIDCSRFSMRLYSRLWLARRRMRLLARGLVKGRWNGNRRVHLK